VKVERRKPTPRELAAITTPGLVVRRVRPKVTPWHPHHPGVGYRQRPRGQGSPASARRTPSKGEGPSVEWPM